MLPLLLIALGAGAFALYMASDHGKATADANLAHQVTDVHLEAARQTGQQADQHAVQQQVEQQAVAMQQATAHTEAAQTANVVAAQKTAQAALSAKSDRDRSITAFQADLTEANKDKIVALRMMQEVSARASARANETGLLGAAKKAISASSQSLLKAMMDGLQAAYDRAQARASAAEAGLRQIGVNPRDIPKALAPPRGDSAR